MTSKIRVDQIENSNGASDVAFTGTGGISLSSVKLSTIKSSNGTTAMSIANDGKVSFTKSLINEVADRTATTSGHIIDFTIPAGTRRITALMRGVSTSDGERVIFQLGTAGGMITSGYRGEVVKLSHSTTPASNNFQFLNGFAVDTQHDPNAADAIHGQYVMTHMGNNLFIGAGHTCRGPDGQEQINISSGKVELGAVCTTLRLTQNGSSANVFDAGEITILTEL